MTARLPVAPLLDRLAETVRLLGRGGTLQVELPADGVQKAVWLRNAGRDLFSVTASLAGAVAAGVQRGVAESVRTGGVGPAYREAAKAAQAHILRRFYGGGYDVRLAPLTPAYHAWKAAHGKPLDVGRLTDTLLLQVMSGTFRVVRDAP